MHRRLEQVLKGVVQKQTKGKWHAVNPKMFTRLKCYVKLQ